MNVLTQKKLTYPPYSSGVFFCNTFVRLRNSVFLSIQLHKTQRLKRSTRVSLNVNINRMSKYLKIKAQQSISILLYHFKIDTYLNLSCNCLSVQRKQIKQYNQDSTFQFKANNISKAHPLRALNTKP